MLGPDCCSNSPSLNPTSSVSQMEVGGFKAYVSCSLNSKQAVLVVSDVYGYEALNLRCQPICSRDYLNWNFNVSEIDWKLFWIVCVEERLDDYGLFLTVLIADVGIWLTRLQLPGSMWSFYGGSMWLFYAGFYVVIPLVSSPYQQNKLMKKMFSKVVKLSKPGLIRAAVLLQPSFITVDDIKRVKVPIAILGAEIDRLSPPELLKQFDEALAAKPEIFTKVSHGRTVRYKVKDELVVKAAEEAPKNAIEWFSKCLKSWNRVPTSL
ncbi:hypothetical protein MLD38_018032 [Melastoma candidum]|uniref:Uncharacterized protein n=1 Tax=Melastoma candidum TaxID=119954 RepID=A0ACB9QTN9_9MYRT|nr:hypothetical protein MLD38_018032 [Melastoma candidum]